MDTIKINSGKVGIVAHRGVSGIECENTCAAFVAAGNRSYYGIETDVHVTRDGKFMLIHDDNTSRVTGGATNYTVEETDSSVLSGLTLIDREYGVPRTDLKVPYLVDYIRICKRYGKVAVLELKNGMEKSAVLAIAEEIKKEGYLEGTIFISFCFQNLVYIKEAYPEQNVQWLTSTWSDDIPEKLAEHKMDIDIRYTVLTPEIISALHAKGIKINCWTCDKREEAEALIGMGVDMITSNILE